MEDSQNAMTDAKALWSSMRASVLYTNGVGSVGTLILPVSRSTWESSCAGCGSDLTIVS